MDADEDGEVSEAEKNEQTDPDDDLELEDLDPNAEKQARRVERQLRRIQREIRG